MTLPQIATLALSLFLLLNAGKGRYSELEHAMPVPPAAIPAGVSSSVADYYVRPNGKDSADGSAARPWQTIQHAAKSVRPGATVHVAPGEYSGPVETTINGTALARIRFVSDVAGPQSWMPPTPTPHGRMPPITWTLRVSISLGPSVWASIMKPRTQVCLNNNVHNIPASQCGNDGGAGIDNSSYTAYDDDIIGNVVHDIGSREKPNQLVHGIYHSNYGGHIANNVVYRAAAWGISLWHAARNVTVSNNTVFNNGAGGIMIGAGNAPGGIVNDHTMVANNIVVRNRGYGISENTATGPANRYLNNLLFQNERGAYYLQNGIRASGSIEADPQFVDYTGDSRGDYHLTKNSPALRARVRLGAP